MLQVESTSSRVHVTALIFAALLALLFIVLATSLENSGDKDKPVGLITTDWVNRLRIEQRESRVKSLSESKACNTIPSKLTPKTYRNMDGTLDGLDVEASYWRSYRKSKRAMYRTGNRTELPSVMENSVPFFERKTHEEGGTRATNDDERGLSVMAAVWGQFVALDLIRMEKLESNCTNELAFDSPPPAYSGYGLYCDARCIRPSYPLDVDPEDKESLPSPHNFATPYLDASFVYGVNTRESGLLRYHKGGKMKKLEDSNVHLEDMYSTLSLTEYTRINPLTVALRELWVMEHNRVVEYYEELNPTLGDEELFQRARQVVIAEIQSITYNEWLPALAGDESPIPPPCFDINMDPRLTTEMGLVGFMFAESMMPSRLDYDCKEGGFKSEDSSDASSSSASPTFVSVFESLGFSSSWTALDASGIRKVLACSTKKYSKRSDLRLSKDLLKPETLYYTVPDPYSLPLNVCPWPLSILHLERLFKLPDYEISRWHYAGTPIYSWNDINTDQDELSMLLNNYGNEGWKLMDLAVGLLAERPEKGSSLGGVLKTMLLDQIVRLRDSDPYYHLWNPMLLNKKEEIQGASLFSIMRKNLNLPNLNTFRGNAFFVMS